jgi:ribosome-binding protein aMBF1 (putative translation factor)
MVVPKSDKKSDKEAKPHRSLVPPTQHTLAAARLILGMSRAVLAEVSGVSLSTIARIEEGNGNPTAKNLQRLAEALIAKGIRFKAADADCDGGVLIMKGCKLP